MHIWRICWSKISFLCLIDALNTALFQAMRSKEACVQFVVRYEITVGGALSEGELRELSNLIYETRQNSEML